MRLSVLIAVALCGNTSLVIAREFHTACELLPASEVARIRGHAVRSEPGLSDAAGPGADVCVYIDLAMRVRFERAEAHSTRAARDRFAKTLAHPLSPTARAEPLRGLGVEARYQPFAQSPGGTIVVRYDTTVITLSGNVDRPTLVSLARAVIAQLSREGAATVR